MPATAALISRLRDAGIAAVVSGAGPSALALTVDGQGPAAPTWPGSPPSAADPWQVLPLRVDTAGARLLPG